MRNVETSRCNVSGEEYRPRFCFELIQTRQPLILAHLAIERYSCETETSEQEGKSEGGTASAAEDHEGVARQLVEDVHQVDLLELQWDEEIILQQLVHRLITPRDFNFNWILEGGSLKLGHLLGHGGREEHRPPLRRNAPQDLVHLHLKVHVQDSVRFVHHQVLERFQAKAFCVFEVVHQSTRGSAQGLKLLRDLEGEFSSGSEYECVEALGSVEQAVQDWKRKGASFPTASLSETYDVLSLQGDGYRLLLDPARLLPSHLLTSLHKHLVQPQLGESLAALLWSIVVPVLFSFSPLLHILLVFLDVVLGLAL